MKLNFIIFLIFLWGYILSTLYEQNSNEVLRAALDPVTVDSKLDHLNKFQGIIKKLNKLLLSYKLCIDRTKNDSLDKVRVQCLGENNNFIDNDLDYEMLRIIGQAAKKIKYIMINYCFAIAGSNMTYQDSCDTFQNDILDLLWKKYDALEIIKANRAKYIYEHARLPMHKFDELIHRLSKIFEEHNIIIKEIMNWKKLTIYQLKEFIESIKKLPSYLDKKKYNELTSNFIKEVIESLTSKKSINLKAIKYNELKKIADVIKNKEGSAPIMPKWIINEVLKAEQNNELEKRNIINKYKDQKNKNDEYKEIIKREKENKLQKDIIENSVKNNNTNDSKAKNTKILKLLYFFIIIII